MTSKKNSLLCPNCRKLISRDEPQCPYCGLPNPGSWWKNNIWTRGFKQPDQLIKAIIYLNAGMFILSILFNPGGLDISMNPLALLSPDSNSLFMLGASGTIPIMKYGRWWTLFSANFLHGSLLHILFNMMAFRQLAPLVTKEFGIYRMLTIYLLGGVAGYLVSFLAGIPFTIGASAAVCSLIGSAIYYGKRRGGAYGQAIYSQLGGWAIFIFIFGFMVPGINNWAHGGGMLTGALLGYLLGFNELKRESYFHKSLAGTCVFLCLGALAWGIISSFLYLIFT